MIAKTYTVKSGDSLSVIARDTLGNVDRWRELAYMNSIAAPYVIYPGQRLVLPSDEPLRITITEGATDQAAPVREASFSFNPATVALIAAGAALIFWDDLFGD